jgi:hypothetical protein
VRVPMRFMDTAAEAQKPRGWVRGFQSLDIWQEQQQSQPPRSAKDPANEAYEEKRARLENSWREPRGHIGHMYEEVEKRRQAAEADWRKRRGSDAAPKSMQDARAAADDAYNERTERMQKAWKQR